MNNVTRNQKGFTLLEIIVVLAVLGALAAMLTPVVFRYVDDANRARAQNDANTIAAAINQMFRDTGRWSFYADGDAKIPYTDGTDAAFLSSDPDCDLTAAAAADDDCLENAPTGGTGWTLDGAIVESIVDQLRSNTRGYTATGPRGWRGPYLNTVPDVDAWGRNYLVNIGDASFDDQTPEVVVVLSAGANGVIDTSGDALATAGLTAGGDDIIARVK
jgi:prepilin-type N-terminal cleavage/methylation domain-containing protein